MYRFLSKAAIVLGAAFFALALASCDVPSEDGGTGWVGTYKTMDTQGKPMEIALKDDGDATGTRDGESLTGSWKADEGDTVVVTWSDDWTTKIAKDGDKYTKTAYKAGAKDGETVSAEKVE